MKYFLLIFPFLIVNEVSAQKYQEQIDSLGQIILERTNTVGSYISILKGDSIIYSSAFGYNDFASKTRLNDSTIFPISSNTKAFNSILLSQLTEKEQVEFDVPLKVYLPSLAFNDSYITQNITLLDLLTHRWGFPRYDFTYYLLNEQENGNEAVFNKLKLLKSTSPFRTQFQYGNNQYILAAYLLEEVTKNKWENQLRDELLYPLKMYNTHCDLEKFVNSDNRSIGYQNQKEVATSFAKSLYDVSGMGNMFSSIRDLEKWMKFLMNGNDSILTKEFVDYTFKSHFNTGYEEPYEGFSSMSYGLGWFVFDYFGHKVVLHHGDNIGHRSIVVLLPEDNISWVIIDNEGMRPYGFSFAMTYSLLDVFLNRKVEDWCSKLPLENNPSSSDSLLSLPSSSTLSLETYQGEYVHKGFGRIKIYLDNNKLKFEAGSLTDELNFIEFNKFISYHEVFKEEMIFEFIFDEHQNTISLKTDIVEPTIGLIEFVKE